MAKKETKTVKELTDWKRGEYNEFVKPGDIVDEATVDYFKRFTPPRLISASVLQAGTDEEYPTRASRYLTFQKVKGHWTYCGLCHYGKTAEPTN